MGVYVSGRSLPEVGVGGKVVNLNAPHNVVIWGTIILEMSGVCRFDQNLIN
jgi:hypothetical protein